MSRFDDVHRRSPSSRGRVLGPRRLRQSIGWNPEAGARRLAGTDVSLVQRRPPEHLLQRA